MNNNKYTNGKLKVIKRVFLGLMLYTSMQVTAIAAHDYIVLGVHPYLPEIEIIKKFTPLANYLSKETGREVRVSVSKNYESHFERTAENVLDIAYMGPASYVMLTQQHGGFPLLARLAISGAPTFRGVIVAHKSSNIESLSQLKGKRFAFGDPQSTMSYLVPKSMLEQAGVPLGELDEYRFLGDHRNVALSVLVGQYDAGAVKEEVFEKYEAQGLKILATTPVVSEHLFITRSNMNTETVELIKASLLNLTNSEEGKEILKSIKSTATALVAVEDKDYDTLREIMFNGSINK